MGNRNTEQETGRMPVYRDMDYARLKLQLETDVMRIDEELTHMPSLVQEVGEILAEAQSNRDMLAHELEVAKAQAAAVLRSQPINDQGKQKSEAQISSELQLERPVRDAVVELENANLSLAMWKSLMEGARTKSKSLSTFSDLVVSGYITPSATTDRRRMEIQQRRRLRREDRETEDA